MQPAIRRILAHQDGVITRRAALEAGLSSSAIGRLIDSDTWSRAGNGVYVATDRPFGDRARACVWHVPASAPTRCSPGWPRRGGTVWVSARPARLRSSRREVATAAGSRASS
ncbi:type IV toxin-antitoxin system AbiEi family antitoxin domain-containing protein [Williamsia sp. M5A3_1d]